MPRGMGQGKKRWDEQSQEEGRHLPKDGEQVSNGQPDTSNPVFQVQPAQ
jgi:hypothetical protein